MQANLAVRERIGAAIGQYRHVLKNRQAVTLEALRNALEDAEVAFQTLRTLETVSQFKELYRESSAEFSTLTQVRAPDLLPLEDKELLEHFIDLSKELCGS